MVALRGAFSGASIVWAAALPLATFAASRPAASSVVALLTLAVYAIGSVICHQRPERSFYLWSHQMPVCARCTGIYIGAALAAIVLAFRKSGAARPRRADPSTVVLSRSKDELRAGTWVGRSASMVLALAALPTIATLAYEWTTGVTPSNWIRAASGLCLGAAVAALISDCGHASTRAR